MYLVKCYNHRELFTNISGGGSSFRLHMAPKLDAVNIHFLAAFEFLFLACQQVELLR